MAIIIVISNKSEANKLIKLFNEGKSTDGMKYVKELLIKYDKDKKSFDELYPLFNYFAKNKSGFIPYNLRKDIELPNPLEGIKYRTLETMENNICDVLPKRLKDGKRICSKIGANNMTKIFIAKATNKIRSVIISDFNDVISNDLMEKF